MDNNQFASALGALVEKARELVSRTGLKKFYFSAADRATLAAALAVMQGVDVAKFLANVFTPPVVQPDTAPPTVPSNLTAVAQSATTVLVSWGASTDARSGVGGYHVLRDGVLVHTTAAAELAWLDTGLAANTTYGYSVVSFDRATPYANASDPTLPVYAATAVASDSAAPTDPSGVSATAVSSTSFTATWTASVDAGSGVKEYRLFDLVTDTLYAIVPAPATSATLTGFSPGQLVSFYVLAYDNAGNHTSSTTPHATVTLLSENPGFALRVNAAGLPYTDPANSEWAADTGFLGGALSVDWGANIPVNGEDISKSALFQTERYGAALQWQATVPNGTYTLNVYFCNHYVDASFPAGYGNISVIKANGAVVFSNVDVYAAVGQHVTYKLSTTVTISTGTLLLDFGRAGSLSAIELLGSSGVLADAVAPTVPEDLTAVALDTQSVRLSWGASTDAGTGVGGYEVRRDGTLIATVTNTNYVDAGLAANTAYSYTVSAFDQAPTVNESAQCTSVDVTTLQVQTASGTARMIFRHPLNNAQWSQALLMPAGSIIFPHTDVVGVDLAAQIVAAHAAGLKVTISVEGRNTQATQATIKADIDAAYAAFPSIDGIFVGDAGWNANPVPDGLDYPGYWNQIASYIHGKAAGALAVIHPGGQYATDAQMQEMASEWDVLTLYEQYLPYSGGVPQVPALYSWMANYSRFKFAVLANGVAGGDLAVVEDSLIAKNVGYLYLTNVDGGAVDDSTYWANEISGLTPASVTQPTAPTGFSVSLVSGKPRLAFSSADGAAVFEINRAVDGAAGGYYATVTLSPYDDDNAPGGTGGHSYVYAVREKKDTRYSNFTAAEAVYVPGSGAAGGSPDPSGGVYPYLSSGVNSNGGTRDLTKHPFSAQSIWNKAVGDGAVFGYQNWQPIPDDRFLRVVNGQKVFTTTLEPPKPLDNLEVCGSSSVLVQMDDSQPMTDVAFSEVGPLSFENRDAPQSGANFQVPWVPGVWVPSSYEDSHGVFLLPGRRTLRMADYVFRGQQYGGVIVCNRWQPLEADIGGPGGTGGTHGATGLNALGGLLRPGELIPVSAGGRGAPRHALALDMPLFWAHTMDHMDGNLQSRQEERSWPCDPYGGWVFAGEYGAYGQDNPEGPLNMSRSGSLLAIPPGVDINALGIQTPAAKMLAWTLQNYGGYVCDHTMGTMLGFYVEDWPGDYSRSFPAQFGAYWGGPFRANSSWSARLRAASGQAPVPWDASMGGSWTDDIDRIARQLRVVLNNGPSGADIGAETLNNGRLGNGIGGGGTPRQPDAPL